MFSSSLIVWDFLSRSVVSLTHDVFHAYSLMRQQGYNVGNMAKPDVYSHGAGVKHFAKTTEITTTMKSIYIILLWTVDCKSALMWIFSC